MPKVGAVVFNLHVKGVTNANDKHLAGFVATMMNAYIFVCYF